MKSGIVISGECKHVHSGAMKEHNWVLGGGSVIELYEYENLGVVNISYFSLCKPCIIREQCTLLRHPLFEYVLKQSKHRKACFVQL